MAYSDFDYERAERDFGLQTVAGILFPALTPVAVPGWLPEAIARLRRIMPLTTEKSRSEVVVVQVLAATEELGPKPLSLYSGHQLNIDPARGLAGECDFILARAEPFRFVRAPVLTVVEAKKQDMDAGLGQCLAQMVGAQLFNERSGQPPWPIWGCVTTGEQWQFLRLDGIRVDYEDARFSTDDLGLLLAALVRTLAV